jgi:glycosyltransferase involved in cell wall biosynthesis
MRIKQETSITFIVGQLGLGGSEKQLYLLIKELILRKWQVVVLYLNSDTGDNWAHPLEQLGATVFSLAEAETQRERLQAITLILKKRKPLIVHSWSFFTNFYAAACGFLAQIPIRLGSERGNYQYSRQRYGRWKYSLSLVGLNALVTNSELEAMLLNKEKPGLRVKVIPNGVDMDGLLSRTKARELLDIPEDYIVIAGIGSLTPNKNFEYLIEAIAKIIFKYPKLKIVLIGDGPERDRLLKKSSELMTFDRIHFLGAVPDAYKLLKGIDILCISSLSEGMPNVVLEAWGAGIPVVANKVGAISSLIKDGVNGFVVEVGDESEFICAVEELICNKNLREEMGELGHRIIQDEYSSQTMADNFVSFYREMIVS